MEYVIFGKQPGGEYEELLLSAVEGRRITSRQAAAGYMSILENKHCCTDCRIVEIDLSIKPDFSKTLNI